MTKPPQPLTLLRLRVRADRVEATVRVAHERYALTDGPLLQACLKAHPSLPLHACRNQAGPTFAAVMERTSTPHLLEHLVIDLQVRAAHDPDHVFTGTTQWTGENSLEALVSVSFEEDVTALAAFSEAMGYLNGLLLRQRP